MFRGGKPCVSWWKAMCFVVESHVFRGGKPCVSGWKTMCFGVKQSFVCVRAATCSCPRSYLFVPAQLPVHACAATCSCLRSYQLKFAWRYTCCSATAYSRDRERAVAEPHVYAPFCMAIFISSFLYYAIHFPIFIFPTPFYPSFRHFLIKAAEIQ